ncbi:cytochrome P450 [Annulohypoxylon truncatum]|uniref:cytochrome P450 n=1 Tax=Annulohypoxylon truncatum TaxID=327061 RepID=UPI0020080861|nr:cytochrome P450 [Annulohypoxylon truncatum]KAI1205002.1 cytochrome P450 [Annulohypoxylon truncatum]
MASLASTFVADVFLSTLLILVAVSAIYLLGILVYNIYFHPLSAYPGPLLARCSRIWYINSLLRGRLPFDVHTLHLCYGETVRIAPDELSCINPGAWKDIYGHRVGKGEVPKDPMFYTSAGVDSVFYAPGERHGRLRRLLSHGFSEKAMREQEATIQQYISIFIQRLRELCQQGDEPVDMVKWYNFFTFDVIGDLAFGDSFGCLATSTYHPWVSFIFNINKVSSFFRAAQYYKPLASLLSLLIPKRFSEIRKNHWQMTRQRALRRWEMHTKRTDLVTRMTDPDSGITIHEFIANSSTLAIAGSDTTATVLSGTTYYLAKNPDKLQKLVREIRSAFSCDEEINMGSVNQLPYLLACLDEGMRIYPPVAGNLPRRTKVPEELDCGFVPANTTISVFNYAMCHSPQHFARPDDFIPERWLDDHDLEPNNKSVVQPFSVGMRNCLGRNLAYFEMRLLLARLLFHFDLEWIPECEDWEKQRAFNLWIRKALQVRLKLARPSDKV